MRRLGVHRRRGGQDRNRPLKTSSTTTPLLPPVTGCWILEHTGRSSSRVLERWLMAVVLVAAAEVPFGAMVRMPGSLTDEDALHSVGVAAQRWDVEYLEETDSPMWADGGNWRFRATERTTGTTRDVPERDETRVLQDGTGDDLGTGRRLEEVADAARGLPREDGPSGSAGPSGKSAPTRSSRGRDEAVGRIRCASRGGNVCCTGSPRCGDGCAGRRDFPSGAPQLGSWIDLDLRGPSLPESTVTSGPVPNANPH